MRPVRGWASPIHPGIIVHLNEYVEHCQDDNRLVGVLENRPFAFRYIVTFLALEMLAGLEVAGKILRNVSRTEPLSALAGSGSVHMCNGQTSCNIPYYHFKLSISTFSFSKLEDIGLT